MEADADYRLHVLYFAWLRERTRVAGETVTVPASVADVRGLIEWLSDRSPGHQAAFGNRQTVRCAVNREFGEPDTPVRDGDEVAFFPPVTGG